VVARLTDPGWETESSASIYVNPAQPSLAILISLRGEQMVQGHLHLCEGRYLHYHSEGVDNRVPVKRQPGVRTQASQIVATVLQEWKPMMVFVGTGNPNKPRMIGDLALPKCWEGHRQVRMQAPVKK
jgi:hypothetical protein